jgi:signal transduction histidine kinase
MTNEVTFNQDAAANREAPLALSLAARLLLPVAAFVISLLSIDFSRRYNFIGPIWPSNAVVLVALLRHVRSLANYSFIFVGGIAGIGLAILTSDGNPALAATVAAGDAIEIAAALTFLSIFHITAFNLTSFRNLLIFILAAGVVAPIPCAIISAIAFGPAHGIPWFAVWRNWYPSHALGMIIVAPFLISVTSRQWQTLNIRNRLGEAAAIFALFIAIGMCAAYFRSAVFAIPPAILFATVRFGLVGATLATFMTALMASSLVVMGIGQPLLSQLDLSDRILALQVFLAITSFWSLPTAVLLTERDRLLGDLSRANSQLTADGEIKSHLVSGLRRHLSIAEEKERLRLSHELHDQAGQSLIAAILEINEIDSQVSGSAHDRLHLLRKKMEELGKTLHRIAWELRPPSIDELGLRKALASYAASWAEQCGTEIDFQCDDPKLDEVPNEIGTAVYRVVQEGLTNIIKHARQPSDVSVVISRAETTLQLIIEDNGCGFDVGAMPARTGSRRGLGLEGMRERLLLIGGTLEIESAVGAGTTIFARIVLDDQRSAA